MAALRTALYATVFVLMGVLATAQIKSQTIQSGELEEFLLKAEIVGAKGISIGITAPKKLTMELNGVTRYAAYKSVEEQKAVMKYEDGRVDPEFQDNWKSEIAAYEIDKIIGLGMVPTTVERTYKGAKGSAQFWVESLMSEAEHRKKKVASPDPEMFNQWMFKTRVYDNLIYNTDRNLENLLITKDWELILIDHSRAFRPFAMLKSPKDLQRFSRSMLEGLKRLNKQNLTEKTGKYLPGNQIDGLLKRRDQILEQAKKLAAEKGEAAVFYP